MRQKYSAEFKAAVIKVFKEKIGNLPHGFWGAAFKRAGYVTKFPDPIARNIYKSHLKAIGRAARRRALLDKYFPLSNKKGKEDSKRGG